MANSPFLAEDIKFSIFQKLRSSIRVDDLGYSKLRNESSSGIDDLISVASLSSVMQAGIS